MTRRYRVLTIIGLLLCGLALAAIFLPWKTWLEIKLTSMLQAQGFSNAHLTVSSLGLNGIELSDVLLGGNPPLILKQVTVGYSLPELLSGHLRDVNLNGLTLEILQTQDKWNVSGLQSTKPSSTPFALPVTSEQLAKYPLNAKLEDSSLQVVATKWKLDVPLHITWQQQPMPQLDYKAAGLKLTAGEFEAETKDVSLNLTLSKEKRWEGQWSIRDLTIKSEIPALQGSGTVMVDANHAALDGKFSSADNSYHASFHINYALNNSATSQATLALATLPWNGGQLSVRNVKIPLGAKQAVNATLEVEHVSIAELMQSFTGKKATGTGVVSGKLPITLGADGTLTLHQGILQADEPGTIALAPDAIPGDNQQVVLVRQILEDLHYSLLSIAVDSSPDKKLSVLMTLQGNNPKVYKGKQVKLNVHLTGDILDVVRQSMLTSNPTKLLQQGDHDKK
jgi:hypothetical protein